MATAYYTNDLEYIYRPRPRCFNRAPLEEGWWIDTGLTKDEYIEFIGRDEHGFRCVLERVLFSSKPIHRYRWSPFSRFCVSRLPAGTNAPYAVQAGWNCGGCRLDRDGAV